MEKVIQVCIGTDRAGVVRARLSLMLVDGDAVLVEHYHSINIKPGDNPNAIRLDVETHLAMPAEASGIPAGPWPAIPDAEWDKVVGVLDIFHTPEVVQGHRARMAALRMKQDPES